MSPHTGIATGRSDIGPDEPVKSLIRSSLPMARQASGSHIKLAWQTRQPLPSSLVKLGRKRLVNELIIRYYLRQNGLLHQSQRGLPTEASSNGSERSMATAWLLNFASCTWIEFKRRWRGRLLPLIIFAKFLFGLWNSRSRLRWADRNPVRATRGFKTNPEGWHTWDEARSSNMSVGTH